LGISSPRLKTVSPNARSVDVLPCQPKSFRTGDRHLCQASPILQSTLNDDAQQRRIFQCCSTRCSCLRVEEESKTSECEARCSKQGTGQGEATPALVALFRNIHSIDVCKSDQSDLTNLHYPVFTPSHKPNLSAVYFDDSSSYNRPNPKHDLQILETACIPAGGNPFGPGWWIYQGFWPNSPS
jgi:hypothetical protein